ncbi:hypothetical protein BS17DRAFT_762874 [Gyrodon lividus]|nr:hypothetical protein BS17DRAFT_762874 [Gyrodon lividus]
MTIIYKDILKDQLWACLLSPNLTAYVQDLAIYTKKNLQTFKIPETALEDSEMTDKITSLISQLLMSARSNMKQKVPGTWGVMKSQPLTGHILPFCPEETCKINPQTAMTSNK